MDIDQFTFGFQFLLFLTLLVSLNGILLKPFLKVLEEREAKITGAQAQVEYLSKIGDEAMADYQARMRQARQKAQQERDQLKEEGKQEERRILAEVRSELAAALNTTRERIVKSETEAQGALETETETLARQIVAKITGKEASA